MLFRKISLAWWGIDILRNETKQNSATVKITICVIGYSKLRTGSEFFAAGENRYESSPLRTHITVIASPSAQYIASLLFTVRLSMYHVRSQSVGQTLRLFLD